MSDDFDALLSRGHQDFDDDFDSLLIQPRQRPYRYIARCSYGNDSIAMLQYMRECGLTDVVVVNNDTGWASEDWPARVAQGEAWVRSFGWDAVTLTTEGFEAMTLNRTKTGMFPTRLRKWCTKDLKIKPFLKWARNADPEKRALVCVGVRRAESKARANHPAFMAEKDDGRHVWHPLIDFSNDDRDAMIRKTPFEILPHRSDECAICINSNRTDLRRASDRDIRRVADLEAKVGRPMFNPAKFQGAEGIYQVLEWAMSDRGKYRPPAGVVPEYDPIEAILDNEPATCEDNWCGI